VDTFFTFNRSYCTRGHIYRLSYFLCILVSMYINIFSNRVVELWNSLPADQPRHFLLLSAITTFVKVLICQSLCNSRMTILSKFRHLVEYAVCFFNVFFVLFFFSSFWFVPVRAILCNLGTRPIVIAICV